MKNRTNLISILHSKLTSLIQFIEEQDLKNDIIDNSKEVKRFDNKENIFNKFNIMNIEKESIEMNLDLEYQDFILNQQPIQENKNITNNYQDKFKQNKKLFQNYEQINLKKQQYYFNYKLKYEYKIIEQTYHLVENEQIIFESNLDHSIIDENKCKDSFDHSISYENIITQRSNKSIKDEIEIINHEMNFNQNQDTQIDSEMKQTEKILEDEKKCKIEIPLINKQEIEPDQQIEFSVQQLEEQMKFSEKTDKKGFDDFSTIPKSNIDILENGNNIGSRLSVLSNVQSAQLSNRSQDLNVTEEALEDSTQKCYDNVFNDQKLDRSKHKPLLDQQISKLEFISDSYIILDSSCHIVYFNKSFCDMLLYQDEVDLMGKEISFLMKMDKDHSIISDMTTELGQLRNCDRNENLTIISRDLPFKLTLQDKQSNISNQNMFTEYRKIVDSNDEWNQQIIGKLFKVKISSSDHFLISPTGNIFLIWNGYIFLLIGILMLLMPYSIVFDNEFAQFQEIVLYTFIIDIILTFNTSIEKDDNDIIVSRKEIAINYCQTWFVLDVLSTVPFDRLFTTNSLDFLQYTKSIKVVAKTVRLAKLLRISKSFNGNLLVALYKNESMRQLINMFKNFEGIQKMFVLICVLLLICHQVSLVYLKIQQSIFNKYDQNEFSKEYNNQIELLYSENPSITNMEVQSITLMNHLLSALGQSSIPQQNQFELVMNASWMLIGQCYYGQMLGEVCSFINVSNQADQELQLQQKTLDEICFTNYVDPRVRTKVSKDLVANYDFNNVDIKQFETKLSKETYSILERSIFKDFMDSFPVFKNLDIETLRFLKQISILDDNTKVLRQKCELDEVFLIIKGKFTIQQVTNDGVKVADEFYEQEIFGLNQFVRWYNDKQDKNINELVNLYTKKLNANNDNKYITKNFMFSLEKSNKTKSVKLSQPTLNLNGLKEGEGKDEGKKKTNSFDSSMIKNALASKIADKALKSKDIKLTQNFIQNRDIQADVGSSQLRIQYKYLEEMVNNNFKNFYEIFMYYFHSIEEISEEDYAFSINEFYKFENHERAGLILSENGNIRYQNNKFNKEFNCDDDIKDNSLFNQLQMEMFNMPYQLKTIDDLPLDFKEKIRFSYKDISKKFNYQQNIKFIVRHDLNNNSSLNKKKSMMKSYFIQFQN